MKKLLFIATMLISGLSFAQTHQVPEKNLETTVSEIISDTADGMKSLGQSTKELFMDAIDVVIEEGSIIITQYIIFTSIKLLLPMLISLLFFFIIKYKIVPLFTISLSKYNELIEKASEVVYSDIKPLFKNNKHFSSLDTYVTYCFFKYSNIAVLICIIANCILPWIKVTFMPKLYLFELITDKLL
jgi:hypothetical protein